MYYQSYSVGGTTTGLKIAVEPDAQFTVLHLTLPVAALLLSRASDILSTIELFLSFKGKRTSKLHQIKDERHTVPAENRSLQIPNFLLNRSRDF